MTVDVVNPHWVLTLSGTDQRGIVAAVTAALADAGCTIRDSQQFGDAALGQFFMRVEFAREVGAVDQDSLIAQVGRAVQPFGMGWHLADTSRRHRLLVMVSKYGHCLNDLLFRTASGALNADVVAIVSNHQDFAELASFNKVPFHHIPVAAATKAAAEDELMELVERYAVDTVILARYMQILSNDLCALLRGRAINIHHSLLPSFKGAKPYHQAHARGVKVLGATAHYVTAELDEGPIIEQDFRRVSHRSSPAQLVAIGRDLEAAALSRAVQAHIENRVVIHGNRTIVFD